MTRPLPLPGLSALGMPLRDTLRGVSTIAAAAEPSAMLPEPFRSRVHAAFEAFRDAGSEIATPPVDHAAIHRAARFVAGAETGPQAAECCAGVLVHAMERMRQMRPGAVMPLSETLTAVRLHQAGQAASTETRAGALMLAAAETPPLPDLGGGPSEEGRLALFTAFAWLLSARSDTMAEEERLLRLAFALTLALREEILQGEMDRADLSRKLHNLSSDL